MNVTTAIYSFFFLFHAIYLHLLNFSPLSCLREASESYLFTNSSLQPLAYGPDFELGISKSYHTKMTHFDHLAQYPHFLTDPTNLHGKDASLTKTDTASSRRRAHFSSLVTPPAAPCSLLPRRALWLENAAQCCPSVSPGIIAVPLNNNIPKNHGA